MPKWQNYSAKSCAKCTNKRQTAQQAILNRKYTLFVTVSRLARSNAFEINNALNTLKGARLTVNLTGKARKSAIDVGRLLIITENVPSSTPSAIVQQPSRHFYLNLAKMPPNQDIADFGRGSSVESESG